MAIQNGSLGDADEVLRVTKIDQVYAGSGYDSTGTEATHELTAVASTDLTGNANYAVVKFTGKAVSNTSGGSSGGEVQLKAQIKETGGSYGDIVAYTIVHEIQGGPVGNIINSAQDYTLVATLTAGMKTNGFQVKLFSKVTNGTGSWTNVQTTLEVRP